MCFTFFWSKTYKMLLKVAKCLIVSYMYFTTQANTFATSAFSRRVKADFYKPLQVY